MRVEQDYWHHWEDVTVGFLLGITIAYIFYRQQFPALTSVHAGEHQQSLPQPSPGDLQSPDSLTSYSRIQVMK